jgi:GNAT superfamily N-acetyltransferase
MKQMKDNNRTQTQEFTIRFAEEKDAATIFGMIKELAQYENMLDQLKATEQLITEVLFQRKVAEALIAEHQRKPAGYAIFFYNFSTFTGRPGIYIEDIYVKPEMRSKGYGKALFAFMAKLAVERNCGRLEWAVLDWNAPSIAFYKTMGASAMEEWTRYKLTGKELKKLAEESAV